MTDNEIIKALDICSHISPFQKCPYYHNGCNDKLLSDTLALINRQKAEIERLTINMNAFGLGMKREKERADRNLDNLKAVLDERANHSEAVKEFAERLKEKHRRITDYDEAGFGCQIFIIEELYIDNLVKEFTEGESHEMA